MSRCLWDECVNETTNPKFCCLSCSQKYQMRYNNWLKKPDILRDCVECGVSFTVPTNHRKQKFCKRSCSATHTNRLRGVTKYCVRCNKECARKYCSALCSSLFPREEKIVKWKSGEWSGTTVSGVSTIIRDYLIEESNYRCTSPDCDVPGGFSTINTTTGKCPLEIDHIDGNSQNNSPDNLRVLCPNCHALTTNYRALNKKSTRTYRKKYYRPQSED